MIGPVWEAYRLRMKRKRFLLRAWRKSSELQPVIDRTGQIGPSDILCFVTLRNEAERLPYFLSHHRNLGIRHFLIVDNASDDGVDALLKGQPDVSLWRTSSGYKAARFGIDWLTWLQRKYGHGHWCLTLDADETLVYPDWQDRPWPQLTDWLDKEGIRSFGAMLLDLYPRGLLTEQVYEPGENPTDLLCWFDSDNYRRQRNQRFQTEWIQGGVRERVFFQDRPERSPTLNKVPLVRWHRSYAYVTSTHHMLPRHLNEVFDTQVTGRPSGVLLHSKFLPSIARRSAEERTRKQHFENSSLYLDYYRRLIEGVDLWYEGSTRYEGCEQLTALGLMSKGRWLN